MPLLQNQHLKGSDMASSDTLDVRWANDDPNPKAVRRVKRQYEEEYMSAVREAVNELPPEQKRVRLLEMQLYGNVQPNSAVAPYPGDPPCCSDITALLSTAKYQMYDQSTVCCLNGGSWHCLKATKVAHGRASIMVSHTYRLLGEACFPLSCYKPLLTVCRYNTAVQ